MRKVIKNETEQAWLAEKVAAKLQAGGKLQVIITGTSATNLSYRYKVILWAVNDSGRVDEWHLNYWLAAEIGQNLTDRDELRGNGCGFDRAHEAAYTIGQLLHRRGLIPADMVNAPSHVGSY